MTYTTSYSAGKASNGMVTALVTFALIGVAFAVIVGVGLLQILAPVAQAISQAVR